MECEANPNSFHRPRVISKFYRSRRLDLVISRQLWPNVPGGSLAAVASEDSKRRKEGQETDCCHIEPFPQ